MLSLYRGHWIMLLRERCWSCEITERSTAAILPTGTSACLDEGPGVCLERARELVDRYVKHSPLEARITHFEASAADLGTTGDRKAA